MKGVLTIRYV